MSLHSDDSYIPEFVEFDPTGRYGRYNEILGKGASKTVYRAFDEYEGIEVAWNQVKLYDFLQSPDDLERLYCEIHLLKTLKHKNIMKFYASWVDISKRNINFVTEMFTSGTLRQYRKMHRRVHIRAIKHWCRQILMGLLYLHSHDPPIIHRDLKCENIFINGNQGEVKIGDLGLAAILRKSHAVHCVGTPEFMAPEVYEEEYNELVDIYSFGMCVLEMVTFEYPYSECKNPAQIYKKVISGVKPDALYRVRDPEVRKFIEKCLATASQRLSAKELLMDPFLQSQDLGSGCWEADVIDIGLIFIPPSYNSESSNDTDDDNEDIKSTVKSHGIDLFDNNDDGDDDETYIGDVDISIKGKKGEDGGIFIRLKIGDKEGHMRNVYFPFDIEEDTALEVAAEMVDELDITDHEVTRIAEMIDGEVSLLVPNWKNRMGVEYVHSNTDSSPSTESNFEFPKLHEQFEDVRAQLEEVQEDSIIEPNAMKKSEENEKKSPRDPREMNIMYQMRAKGSRKGSLASRSCRNPNLALDLDVIKKYDEKNDKIQNPTPIQSFHLSRNSSCKRPDSEIEQSLSSNSAAQDEEMNQDVLEKIFPKNSCYVGEYLPASLPRARSLCI